MPRKGVKMLDKIKKYGILDNAKSECWCGSVGRAADS